MVKKATDNKNSSSGFTLLEALIAIVILSVGLLGVATLAASIIGSNQFAGQFSAATTLARDRVEELKNMTYASITPDTTTTETGLDEDGGAGGFYTRTTVVADNTGHTGWKDVTVTVSWTLKGNARSVVLRTIVSESVTRKTIITA